MPILIAHRGLWNDNEGIHSKGTLERNLNQARETNYIIELDIRIDKAKKIFVGHDTDTSFDIDIKMLLEYKENILVHLKEVGIESTDLLLNNKFNFFIHSTEPIIFTSLGWPMCHSSYCNSFLGSKNIGIIMPEYSMSLESLVNYGSNNPYILTENGAYLRETWKS